MNKYQEALDRVLNHVNLKVAINDEHGLPKILRDNQGYQDLELMQKLVDKETKVSKLHEEIYDAYHHGTKEECDKQVSELIYQIEYDWVDSDE